MTVTKEQALDSLEGIKNTIDMCVIKGCEDENIETIRTCLEQNNPASLSNEAQTADMSLNVAPVDAQDGGDFLPPIETFTGHNHTLQEDIDDLTNAIYRAEHRGTLLMHTIHMTALLYNLQCAVEYLEKIGIKTFAQDRSHENTIIAAPKHEKG